MNNLQTTAEIINLQGLAGIWYNAIRRLLRQFYFPATLFRNRFLPFTRRFLVSVTSVTSIYIAKQIQRKTFLTNS